MNLRNQNKRGDSDAVMIGRALLTELLPGYLEAFSENALCSSRGMSTMKKYKTVKEVCALTGLTRKHLYYFHHEKVVEAVAYANYSVNDYDGYKLYDDVAVEKLQQIALYYQLGLKRNEIRDIMKAPGYDPNMVLDKLLREKRNKRLQIDRHIAVLEFMKLIGLKNGHIGNLCKISIEDLGQSLMHFRNEEMVENLSDIEAFEKEFSDLLFQLCLMSNETLYSNEGASIIKQIFNLAQRKFGSYGLPLIVGLFASTLGEGDLAEAFPYEISSAQCKAVMQYIARHQEFITNGGNHEEISDI